MARPLPRYNSTTITSAVIVVIKIRHEMNCFALFPKFLFDFLCRGGNDFNLVLVFTGIKVSEKG